jgi:hypothetical protein
LIREGVPLYRVEKNDNKMVYAVIYLNKNRPCLEPKPPTLFLHAFKVMLETSEATWKEEIEMMKSNSLMYYHAQRRNSGE